MDCKDKYSKFFLFKNIEIDGDFHWKRTQGDVMKSIPAGIVS